MTQNADSGRDIEQERWALLRLRPVFAPPNGRSGAE